MGLFRGGRNRSSFTEPDVKAKKDKKKQKLIPDDEGEYVDYEDIDK